ncbi:MAG: hypothetical protein P9M07_03715 [Candidatus Aceula meridiana]|nr:hypothetical protein [Candidatus Aceula meridiana]
MFEKIVILTIFIGAFFCSASFGLNYPENGPYEEYYSDGSLKFEGYFKNGLEDGIFKNYSLEGWLVSERTYEKGRSFGLQKEYYPNGKLNLEWTVNDLGLEGSFKTYSQEGVLVREEIYRENVLKEVRSYAGQGKVLFSQKVEAGIRLDHRYRKDGTIERVFLYHDDEKGEHCTEKYFRKSGKLSSETYSLNGEKYKRHNYDGLGNLMASIPSKNGKTHGHVQNFHSNGKVSRDANYVEGSAQGEAIVYDEYGNVRERSLYKDSMLIWAKYYTPEGDLMREYIPSKGNIYK